MSSQLELSCIQGGINPLYKCFAWSKHRSEAFFYACGHSVVVCDASQARNHLTLNGHSDRVNFVKAFHNFTDRQLLISGGSDSNLIVWESDLKTLFNHQSWHVKYKINLTHSVSFASIFEFAPNQAYVVAGNITGDVFILSISDGQSESVGSSKESSCALLDNIRFGHHFTQECAVLFRPNSSANNELVLALGGLDFSVHIYFVDLNKNLPGMEKGSLFEYKASLKGHENAITDIQVLQHQSKAGFTEWILASSSKDGYIRLWRLSSDEGIKQISEFQNKQTHRLTLGAELQKKYFIALESILSGHSETVVCLDWGIYNGEVALISASFDFSIIIWTKDQDTDIWLCSYRLGQVSGSKYAFFQVGFNSDCKQILSYTYTGSFYLWEHNSEKNLWESKPTVSGHSNQVFDLDWSTKGDFLVSCGLDQMTRIYAESSDNHRWSEVSRAQIHGYDINSIKCFPVKCGQKNICDTLICGADEKVVRLFEPPASFVNAVNQISSTDLHLFFQDDEEEKKYLDRSQLEKGVYEYQVSKEGGSQVLGLMTKAVKFDPEFDPSKYIDPEDEGGLISDKIQLIEDKKKEDELFSQKHDFKQPPIEDYLVKHTLWPELNKLYGHGYELKCVGCSHDGQLIVSCSKSQTKENACVIFWNPSNYQIYSKLEYHNFTINQFEFSPTDEYFGTVSKDRSLAVYRRNYLSNDQPNDAEKNISREINLAEPYVLHYSDKSHTRIIYSLSFSHDDSLVVTGARDKRVKIHSLSQKKILLGKLLANTVTAVCFAPKSFANESSYLLVIGFEDGNIEMYQYDSLSNELKLIDKPHPFLSHTNAITRIKFRKNHAPTKDSSYLQFATSSLDHTVRIFNFNLS